MIINMIIFLLHMVIKNLRLFFSLPNMLNYMDPWV